MSFVRDNDFEQESVYNRNLHVSSRTGLLMTMRDIIKNWQMDNQVLLVQNPLNTKLSHKDVCMIWFS